MKHIRNYISGRRLGWLIGPAEAISHVINLTTHTTYGVPGFIQDAGLFALSQGPAFEDRIAAPFRRRHEAVRRLLTARGIGFAPSAATMYLMVDIRPTFSSTHPRRSEVDRSQSVQAVLVRMLPTTPSPPMSTMAPTMTTPTPMTA